MTASAQTDSPTRVLIADDHAPTLAILRTFLERKAYAVTTAATGDEACEILTSLDAPCIALIDWEMPGASGLEVCRTVRGLNSGQHIFLIVITGRDEDEDIGEAMAAGADDFIHKPCGASELLARVRNGERTIALQHNLASRIVELEESAERMRKLKRLLPICMYCKKIRDDSDYWQEIDVYIQEHTDTDFSHGICPSCMTTAIGEFTAGIDRSPKTGSG
jgi:phosphoserine phosphatase RsbU/P